jgi:hypothetical protein
LTIKAQWSLPTQASLARDGGEAIECEGIEHQVIGRQGLAVKPRAMRGARPWPHDHGNFLG